MIEVLRDPDPGTWRYYCEHHDAALFTHVPGWSQALASAYDLQLFLLYARNPNDSGKPAGILPLLLFNPPDSPSRLISLPYSDAAGLCADSEEIRRRLLHAALDLAGETGAAHLELRQYDRLGELGRLRALDGSWCYREHTFKIGLRRKLPAAVTDLWHDLGTKVRNQVRKADRSGCVSRCGGRELLDAFYDVFSENMRDLGSATHSYDLFYQALSQGTPVATCIVIFLRGIPVAGALVFQHGTTLYNPWASSLRRFRPACPNMLLYWTMLSRGVQRGCRWFDFGRSSPGAPTCHFKMQWAAEARPLFWHVFSRKPHLWQPEHESLVDEAWKQMGLEASRRQGPAVRRWISL